MRAAFVRTVTKLLDENPKVVLLLGDISVHTFKEARDKHPLRVLNVGINEQAMVGMAAGLARAGMYPIVHTIAPFLVERAFEQLKIDFGYQGLAGCFVSVGASYDYATMGCTHHCPGDVALMLTIPGMEIYAPGHPDEVGDWLPMIVDGACAYMRLSETQNPYPMMSPVVGMSNLLSNETAIVIAAGPTLGLVPQNASYFFMGRLDRTPPELKRLPHRKVLVLEPFYAGTLTPMIAEAMPGAIIKTVGVPRAFLDGYGTREQFDARIGMTVDNVNEQWERLCNG